MQTNGCRISKCRQMVVGPVNADKTKHFTFGNVYIKSSLLSLYTLDGLIMDMFFTDHFSDGAEHFHFLHFRLDTAINKCLRN